MASAKDGGGKRRRIDFSIEKGAGDTTFHVHIPDEPPTEPVDTMPLNSRWTYLSPLTLRVTQLLCREGWLSREQIAERLNESPEGDIRPLLTDLAKRGIVEPGKKGYHIAIPDDVDPETYRKQLLEWLETQARKMPDAPN